MTNGQFVSSVVNELSSLQKDDHISRRFILQRGRDFAKLLLSQKLQDGTLYKDSSLFSTIKCFKLKEDNILTCDVYEFRRCNSLMKSVKKIPGLAYSRYGSSIVRVTSIDGSIEFQRITPQAYMSRGRLRVFVPKKKSKHVYYEEEGYLYIPDSTLEAVNITVISVEQDNLVGLGECDDKATCTECSSIWDFPFTSNDRFDNVIVTQVVNELAGITKRLTKDEQPNLDANIKT